MTYTWDIEEPPEHRQERHHSLLVIAKVILRPNQPRHQEKGSDAEKWALLSFIQGVQEY
jgi:hypothetical protein